MARIKPQPWSARKAKGDDAERIFMEKVALLGGTAHVMGCVPGDPNSAPRYCHPDQQDEDGFYYSVSPDIAFDLPNMEGDKIAVAQVKVKALQTRPHREEAFVYLDVQEHARMRKAHRHYDVHFVIYLPELEGQPELSPWQWVNFRDLTEDRVNLLKRTVCEKPTYLLPLHLFRPLADLGRTPANAIAAPRNLMERVKDYERGLLQEAAERHPTVSEQARILGIPRSTLQSKRVAHGLDQVHG